MPQNEYHRSGPIDPRSVTNEDGANKKAIEAEQEFLEYREYLSRLGKMDDSTDRYFNMLNSNLLFAKNVDWYTGVNRYGWLNPFDNDKVVKEFLFFTKPDLNIFAGDEVNDENGTNNNHAYINASITNLADGVRDNPVICEVARRKINILRQLQVSVKEAMVNGVGDGTNPFMYLLTNAVTSKLDLPGITADSQDTTPNVMGTSIQYRGHSLKSDNGYDFSLSFTDTAYLDIYLLAKCYDEYMRMVKTGLAQPKKKYIISKVLSEQFSIYKFLIGSDGETILYYAKLTGCYFTDAPRSDMADPADGIKFSLSFHAQFVEDMNPEILTEFNTLCRCHGAFLDSNIMNVYDDKNGMVDNRWATCPYIVKANRNGPNMYTERVKRRNVEYDYFLKWKTCK